MPYIITNGDAFCHQTKNRAVQIVEDPALATQFRDEDHAQRLLDRATKKLKGFQIVASTPIPAPAEEVVTSTPNAPDEETNQPTQKRERRSNRRHTPRSEEPAVQEPAAVQPSEDDAEQSMTAEEPPAATRAMTQHTAEAKEEAAQSLAETDVKESASELSSEDAHPEDNSPQSSRRSSRRRRSRSRGSRGQAQNNSGSPEEITQAVEETAPTEQPSPQAPEPSSQEIQKPESKPQDENPTQEASVPEPLPQAQQPVPQPVPQARQQVPQPVPQAKQPAPEQAASADDIFAEPAPQQEHSEKPARNQRRGRGNNRHAQNTAGTGSSATSRSSGRRNSGAPMIDANHRRRMWTTQERYQVYNSTEGHCGICGCFIPLEEYTIDHIIPLSKGGTNDLSNLQPCCSFCNKAKDDSMGEEFYFRIARIFLHQAELRYSKKQYKKLKKLLKELEG